MEMSAPPPDSPAPQEKLRLKVVEGNAAGRVIEVEEEFVIGRQAKGDGTLASDVEISRQHARVFPDSDGRFGIEDLGSTNGTFVNGRRLDSRVILETGDRISVGASALIVQVGSLQPTPRASGTIAPLPAEAQPPTEQQPPAEEAAAVEPEEAAPLEGARAVASFALRIEVDTAAGRATVALDDSADEVTLVYEDGRWRLD